MVEILKGHGSADQRTPEQNAQIIRSPDVLIFKA